MGWTGFKTNKSFLEVFKSEYREWFENPYAKTHIVLSIVTEIEPEGDCVEAAEIFSAVQQHHPDGDYIYGHVLLINRTNDGEVLYKGMHEMVGPYTLNKCPQEVLMLLSSSDIIDQREGYTTFSKDWRKNNGG